MTALSKTLQNLCDLSRSQRERHHLYNTLDPRQKMLIENWYDYRHSSAKETFPPIQRGFQKHTLNAIQTLSKRSFESKNGDLNAIFEPSDYFEKLQNAKCFGKLEELKTNGSIIDGLAPTKFFSKIPDPASITGYKSHTFRLENGDASEALDQLIKGVTLICSNLWPCIAYHMVIRNFLRSRSIHEDQDHRFNELFSPTGTNPLTFSPDIEASSLKNFVRTKQTSEIEETGDIVIFAGPSNYPLEQHNQAHVILDKTSTYTEVFRGFIYSKDGLFSYDLQEKLLEKCAKEPLITPYLSEDLAIKYHQKLSEQVSSLEKNIKVMKIFAFDYKELFAETIKP